MLSDYSGMLVVALTVTVGVSKAIGVNTCVTFVVDSDFHVGLIIGITFLIGGASKGAGFSVGFLWGMNTIDEYYHSILTSLNVADGVGVGTITYHPEYNHNDENKEIVGIQILIGTVGAYYESADFDKPIFIDLSELFSQIADECGRSFIKFIDYLKKIKIIFT